jgi:hypothetical protein
VTYLRRSTGIRIININAKKRPQTQKNVIKRSKTIENAHNTLKNGHERSGTMNGQERLGTIESERSNALERKVENGHGAFTVRSRSCFKNERIIVHVPKTDSTDNR